MAEDEEPEFSAQLICVVSNAELDRLIAELGTHPLAQWEVRFNPQADGSLVVRCIQVLDSHSAGGTVRLQPHARLITIRKLDASGHEGTLDIIKSASVGSSPA
jgi:hypothetical protein